MRGMISREKLVYKTVVFRLAETKHVYPGKVVAVEPDGLWLESPEMMNQLKGDMSWGFAVRELKQPLIFVPNSALMYLMVEKEATESTFAAENSAELAQS